MEHFITHPLLSNRIRQFARGDDDAAQFMRLRLLEAAAADSRFADQAPGFHVKRAAWERRHYAERVRTYDRYVGLEPHVLDPETGAMVSIFDELVRSDAPNPERSLIQRERLAEIERAIDALNPLQRRIVKLLVAGDAPSAIADKLAMSRSAVSHAIARARAALSAAL